MDGGIFVATKGFEPERRSARALIASAAGGGISEQSAAQRSKKSSGVKPENFFGHRKRGGTALQIPPSPPEVLYGRFPYEQEKTE